MSRRRQGLAGSRNPRRVFPGVVSLLFCFVGINHDKKITTCVFALAGDRPTDQHWLERTERTLVLSKESCRSPNWNLDYRNQTMLHRSIP
jgi:hypothetical protein